MSIIREKVDRFLFRFNYSIKIKSIIFMAAFAAAFIAIMLIRSQFTLSQSIKKQTFGIAYEQVMGSLFQKALLHNVYSYQKSSEGMLRTIEGEVDALLADLATLNEKAISKYFYSKTAVKDDLLYKYYLIQEEWQNVKQQTQNMDQLITTHLKLIEAIKGLSFTSNYLFELFLNIDTSTHHLINASNRQLFDAQTLIPTLIELKLEEKEHPSLLLQAKRLSAQTALQDRLSKIQQNIDMALETNQLLKKKNLDSEVGIYLISAQRFNEVVFSPEVSNEKILQMGVLVINNGVKLFSALQQQILMLLDEQQGTLSLRESFGSAFIIFGIVSVLGAYTTRLIRRPLSTIRDAAEQLAKGNLSVRIDPPAKDEVGLISEAFNQLVDQIGKIIHNVGEVSSHLAASSNNIFTTAEQLESNVARQEQAITHIARNAKGVSRTVHEFASTLQEATHTATSTAHLASLGQESLTEMEEIMHQIAKASMNIVKTLSDLEDKVTMINNVINTIIKIADQINLLSLNTAIRAGKPNIQHMGFTVLADKISELADQTALATLDIEKLVQHIIKTVSEAVLFVDQFSDQIRTQVYEATEIGDNLKQLIGHTQEQVKIFETVNEGMQEQSSRATQIHESISSLTSAAQGTTQSVRNLYLEIEYLHHSTNNLQSMAKKLTQESFEELFAAIE